MITVTDLSHSLDNVQVLNGVNVRISKGEITALVGPNGAGKSTLLSLIARLETCRNGTITVDELNVATCSSNALAKRLAILPQALEIAPRLSVEELVSFGRYPHHLGRATPEDKALVRQAMAFVNLDDFPHRTLDTLSGGQRQRAYLAMIFAQNTDYVLLDEPLNNLDIAASRSLMSLLTKLCRELGKTVVIVLHDINYACAYADRILTLRDGRVGPCGRPEDVVSQTFIRDVFGTDAPVYRRDGRIHVSV